ncbi:uncharacterized protein METZ01_LOCUS135422, partial [marine metagenome]
LKHGTAENAVPMTKTGIYGLASVGRDAADNVGVGGITKVIEDVSASFAAAVLCTAATGGVGTTTADCTGAANDTAWVKLKKWPLADHDGDGSLMDSITAITVGGTSPTNLTYVDMDAVSTSAAGGGFRYESTGDNPVSVTSADAISAYISKIDWSEQERVELTAVNAADVSILAGNTVKVTYYYVNAEQVVELDLDAPEVTILPANLASTIDKTPSLSFAWDDDEYAGDTNTTVTMTKATLLNPDATTTDVLAEVSTTDNKTFYYVPIADLANGEYKITVSAEDVAGNEKKDQTSKFTVKDRSKTTVAMVPGWNLVSLPAAAADSAINSVITNTQVETVLTYDPSTPGGWLTAVRDGDSLVGTLTDIDDSHAYWIFQNNGDDIKVDIPGYKGGASSVPPVISVVEGWNLVPAATLSGAAQWDADTYFSGLDWVKAKGYNASSEAWIDIIPDVVVASKYTYGADATDNIYSGKGYWLFSNSAGVIVP